jgi:hypothetical protein
MSNALLANRANGMSDIEGKVARVAMSECGQRASFNGAFGKSDIEDKPRWAAASELESEGVSNGREHMSQCGQRASFNAFGV